MLNIIVLYRGENANINSTQLHNNYHNMIIPHILAF